MTERHNFRIPIGDWSGDGHGRCDYFAASAAKPIEAVREAFFAAQKKLPKLDPTTWCSDYEDSTIPDDVLAALNEAGLAIEEDYFEASTMAQAVVWFLNQGDSELDARMEAVAPSLAFYGYDPKGRHIETIGYGMMGS